MRVVTSSVLFMMFVTACNNDSIEKIDADSGIVTSGVISDETVSKNINSAVVEKYIPINTASYVSADSSDIREPFKDNFESANASVSLEMAVKEQSQFSLTEEYDSVLSNDDTYYRNETISNPSADLASDVEVAVDSSGYNTEASDTDSVSTSANQTKNVPLNDSIPMAKMDSVTLLSNDSVIINVLANDSGLEDGVDITIAAQPESGVATVVNNQVLYSHFGDLGSNDKFTYRITDSNGDVSLADVAVSFDCMSTACKDTVELSWDHSKSLGIVGYKLHVGTQPDIFEKAIYVGNVTEYEYILEANGTYFFAISAINYKNIESDLSESFSIVY